ncbi:hypothetical protein UFOVP704_30 [uncultured Caudovirales phage]|uniref:Uncharacterized protein n=1 Tax=uncultured Caudovirales phage TaxID=2100421 RepID=A0A6J5NUG9_9CAUD|nr:hypothetical protein UFOVP704_30 [uncultured Caudovirales phage]
MAQEREPNKTWFDFYNAMRENLNYEDRKKLNKLFFNQEIEPFPVDQLRTQLPLKFFNKPAWDVEDIYGRPDIALYGETPMPNRTTEKTAKTYNDILRTQPPAMFYDPKYDEDKMADPNFYTYADQEIFNRRLDSAERKRLELEELDGGLLMPRTRKYEDNPELKQVLNDANFEKKWEALPDQLRKIMSYRRDLYGRLTPEMKELITPTQPEPEPIRPKRVDWDQSRTKNLATDPIVKDQLVARILQSLSGNIEPDFQAGTIDPSVAGGNASARDAINKQNIAVVKERMAARGEATPWLARFLAPETPSGMIMDPRLNLPGFTEDHTMRPRLSKNDPIVKQIEAQNKSIKQSTQPSRRQQDLNRRNAATEVALMEDDLKHTKPSKRKWFGGLLGGAIAAQSYGKRPK